MAKSNKMHKNHAKHNTKKHHKSMKYGGGSRSEAFEVDSDSKFNYNSLHMSNKMDMKNSSEVPMPPPIDCCIL